MIRSVTRKITRPVIGDILGSRGGSWESYWAAQDWGNFDAKIKTIIASKDTLINLAQPTYNYGAGINLAVGEYNSAVGTVTRSLIDFDLSSIADGNIDKASLFLYRTTDLASNTRSLKVYRLKRSWNEGTGNGSATADGATWNTYDGSNSWTTAGAFDAADCEQEAIGEVELAQDMSNGWIEIPLNITSKSELTLGYGFLLKMDTELNDGHVIRSKNNADVKPYILIEQKKIINGTVSPLLTQSSENPLFTGVFGSVVYEGVNSYSFYYAKVSGDSVFKRTSSDGITWNAEQTLFTDAGKLTEVCSAWKEEGTYYMLIRSNKWGSDKDIGLYRSSDGDTWIEEATNPVITHTDIGAWCTGDIDPWGIIKIGLTYYLWLNDVGEIPRQSGLATSIDLVNWNMNANNPIFDNGRYCVAPIKYKDKYYMFVPYTPDGNVSGADPIRYRIELYRDALGTFLPANREFLGNIHFGGQNGEWDDDYLDTPSILTGTIFRDTFPAGTDKDGKLWMYYTGHDGSAWSHGLSVGHLEMLDKLQAIAEPAAGE